MKRRFRMGTAPALGAAVLIAGLAAGFAAAAPQLVAAQEPGAGLLEAGAEAPDIELTAATRHGVLRDKIKLSDYRGETVVLAFFFRVRTRG